MPPIRLGILGAGLFARDAHLPNLLSLTDSFELVAVCSRTADSARLLNEKLPTPVPIHTDMDEFLAREDMDAVDIVLPIALMPQAIEKALQAGKHIISEKPMSPSVEAGQKLLMIHAQYPNLVWMVAENWRYAPAVQQARQLLENLEIGRPLLAHWAIHVQMSAENKYYHTAWRRDESFRGGFLMDGGVHHAAGWRFLLGDVASVSATATQIRPDLPPADTLSAALQFESGLLASYAVTYAGRAPQDTTLNIVGEKGALHVNRDVLTLMNEQGTQAFSYEDPDGIRQQFAAFAESIVTGAPHLNSPAETLKDVALIEAMLDAAESGQRVKPQQIE